MEDQRQLVDVLGVGGVDDRTFLDVAQAGDLALEIVGQRLLAAAHDHVGLDTAAAQLGDRVLRGLGLLLARRADERHEGDVDVADVVAPDHVAELTDRFEERQDLDVADGAAHFGDHHVDVVVSHPLDAALDLVGDVRDHLNGLAEVVATTLRREHRLIDRAGRGVGVPRQVLVDESLVVAEVEVGLTTVVGHEHLAVFERVHRARIDVDVRIELLERDPQAAQLEQSTERRGSQALAERAGNASRHENVLRHLPILRLDSRCPHDTMTGNHHTPPRACPVESHESIPDRTCPPRSVGTQRSRSSRAWSRAESVVEPDSIRATSATRCSPSMGAAWAKVSPPLHRLGDGDLHVGRGCHLGEVCHHEHLMRPAQLRERVADRLGSCATDSGIDLVEHQRATVLGPTRGRDSTSRSASIARASSPPEATLVSGSRGDPGFAASRNWIRSPG